MRTFVLHRDFIKQQELGCRWTRRSSPIPFPKVCAKNKRAEKASSVRAPTHVTSFPERIVSFANGSRQSVSLERHRGCKYSREAARLFAIVFRSSHGCCSVPEVFQNGYTSNCSKIYCTVSIDTLPIREVYAHTRSPASAIKHTHIWHRNPLSITRNRLDALFPLASYPRVSRFSYFPPHPFPAHSDRRACRPVFDGTRVTSSARRKSSFPAAILRELPWQTGAHFC